MKGSPDQKKRKSDRKEFFLLLFSMWILWAWPAAAETNALFTPEANIQETLLRELESTASTLELAIHDVTSPEMARALVKTKQRGVKIRVIADSRQSKLKASQITYLIQQGIQVKVLGGKEKGVMNHRFGIFDGKKVITGSYDWSKASGKWNYEHILVLEGSDVVASFQEEFDRLWREKRVIQ